MKLKKELVKCIIKNYQNSEINYTEAKELLDYINDNSTTNVIQDDIAVIGMSGMYPESPTVDDFWDNISNNINCVNEVPDFYLDKENYYSQTKEKGKAYCKWAGILNRKAYFDPLFFNISPKEAMSMNTQQRLILQEGWKAIEDAGYDPKSLSNKNVGIYIGAEPSNYVYKSFTGASDAIVSSRLSYYLNLKGPSMVINTACSSSAVAIHIACQSILSGEISMALAGGVFSELDQDKFIALSQIEMLSKTGKCYTFDSRADGTVLSEGVGVICLKPLKKAIEDKDNIYGIIKASGINQDGTSNGITAPNGLSQEELITQVYKKFNVNPEDISYIEAHGTGTPLGDPIEISALTRAFEKFTNKKNFCIIGSSKTNIGHTGAAAGVAGIIKILKSINNKKIPKMLNFNELNKEISLEGSPFLINNNNIKWTRKDGKPLLAALNAFGHSGTNAHIVLEEYIPNDIKYENKDYYIIPLSAFNNVSLELYIQKLRKFLKVNRDISIDEISYTFQYGRCHMEKRLLFIVRNVDELINKLDSYSKDTYSFNKEIEIINDSKIQNTLEQWINGKNISWDIQFHKNEVKRISLPTYAFDEQFYWKGEKVDTIVNNDKSINNDELINNEVIDIIKDVLKLPINEINHNLDLTEYGVDETTFSLITKRINERFDTEFTIDKIIQLGTINNIIASIKECDYTIVKDEEVNEILEAEKLFSQMILSTLVKNNFLIYKNQVLSVSDKCEELKANNLRWIKETLNILCHRNEIIRINNKSYSMPCKLEDIDYLNNIFNSKKDKWLKNKLLNAQIILAENMLSYLNEVLTGIKLPTDIMFPNSSIEKVKQVYSENNVLVYFNNSVAKNICKYINNKLDNNKDKISIIEIGAGTGSTTDIVLKELNKYKNNIKEYCYTDISKAFLSYGKNEYLSENPFMKFKLLNIENPIEDQSFNLNDYDIVLATNVLHATRNIKNTLSNCKNLLKKDGLIVINEMTDVSIFTHLTFGLLDGWWLFEDEELRIEGSPAIKDKTWKCQLEDLGFNNVVFPEKENHYLGQQIILANSNGIIIESKQQNNELEKTNISKLDSNVIIDETIKKVIAECLCDTLELNMDILDYDKEFSFYGLDSILAVNLIEEISKKLDLKLETPILYNYSTVNSLSSYVTSLNNESYNLINSEDDINAIIDNNCLSDNITSKDNDDIAIIGISGRFGKCNNINEYWDIICNGEEIIEDVTRWDKESLSGGNKDFCSKGSFLKDIDKFDANFFNISGVEATYMDPQQRILLEESWNALEDAGYVGDNLKNESCGIYIGCTSGDYQKVVEKEKDIPAQAFWGNLGSMIPARIAYYLDIKGPAISIDTACSSSLAAINLACEAIWNNKISMALSGGVYVQSTPYVYESANRAGMLSKTGRCYAFDDRADGFVPGEGVGVIVLKKLHKAISDGDNIYAVIKGVAMNQDGKSNGITAPNGVAQENLEKDVYDSFNVNPEEIEMIEAHGTGTKLGDPIEFNAITSAFKHYTEKSNYCSITSVKSNIGHTQSAAGVASVVKGVLSLNKEIIPPTINVSSVNRHINIDNSPFYINTKLKKWVKNDFNRKVSVSAFGVSGTNVHMVLEEAPKIERVNRRQDYYIIAFSSKRQEDLCKIVSNFVGLIKNSTKEKYQLKDISYTLLARRKHFNNGICFVTNSIDDMINKLDKWLLHKKVDSIKTFNIEANNKNLMTIKDFGNTCIEKINNCKDNTEYLELLNTILDLYAQGYHLNYSNIFTNDNAKTISLPTYPFDKKSYWVKNENCNVLKTKNNNYTISAKSKYEDSLNKYINMQQYQDNWLEEYKKITDSNKDLEDITGYMVLKIFIKNNLFDKDITSYKISSLRDKLNIHEDKFKEFMNLLFILEDLKYITIDNDNITLNNIVFSENTMHNINNIEKIIENLKDKNENYKDVVDILYNFSKEYINVLLNKIDYLSVIDSQKYNNAINNASSKNFNLTKSIVDIISKVISMDNTKKNILYIDNKNTELDKFILELIQKNSNIQLTYGSNSLNNINKLKNSGKINTENLNFEVVNFDNLKWSLELEEKSFDIVICNNTLSSNYDVNNSMNYVNYLLNDNGILIINELTKVNNYERLMFGLAPAWWNYNDEKIRIKGSPMLSQYEWQNILNITGFNYISSFGAFPVRTIDLNEVIIISEKKQHILKDEKLSITNYISSQEEHNNSIDENDELCNTICDIWKSVLDIDKVGFNDNFMEIGGDSILMTQIISRIDKLYPYNLDLKPLFNVYTISEMAQIVEEKLVLKLSEMDDDELNTMFE